MKYQFRHPRWPKDSFWDVIAFKFPLLSTSLLGRTHPSPHQLRIMDESLTQIDFDQEVDLVAITAITPLAPRDMRLQTNSKEREKVVMGGIHASWLPKRRKPMPIGVAIGEADETWVEILEDAEKGTMKPFYRQKREQILAAFLFREGTLFPSEGVPLSQSHSDHKGLSL